MSSPQKYDPIKALRGLLSDLPDTWGDHIVDGDMDLCVNEADIDYALAAIYDAEAALSDPDAEHVPLADLNWDDTGSECSECGEDMEPGRYVMCGPCSVAADEADQLEEEEEEQEEWGGDGQTAPAYLDHGDDAASVDLLAQATKEAVQAAFHEIGDVIPSPRFAWEAPAVLSLHADAVDAAAEQLRQQTTESEAFVSLRRCPEPWGHLVAVCRIDPRRAEVSS